MSYVFKAGKQGSSEIKITHVATSTSEVAHTLQVDVTQIWINSQGNDTLYIAFAIGETLTNYKTLPPGNTLTLEGILFTGKILYIRSSSAVGVAEVLETY